MADKKISGLSANSTLNGTELFELVQSGSNVKALLSAIKTYIINGYLTAATAASTYATTSSLTSGLLANLTPTINTQPGTSYTVGTVAADNDGKTYLRMTNASANTATITTAQTKPISIRQAGAGTTTIGAADAGVTLNGNLVFSAKDQTKTIIPLGSGVFDVVG